DPIWHLYSDIKNEEATRINPVLTNYYTRMADLNSKYLKYRMEKDGSADYYPDANLTLRLSYGQVKGIDPDGPAEYSWQTNIDQTIAKHQEGSHEFHIPERLREIYAKKDFGRWTEKGTVPVNFIADNHTSGGNS